MLEDIIKDDSNEKNIENENAKKVIKEYDDIINKLKEVNKEIEKLSESTAKDISTKLKDTTFNINTFKPSLELDLPEIKAKSKEFNEQKCLLYSNIVKSLAFQKDFLEAIKYQKKIIKFNPSDIEPNKELVKLTLEGKSIEEAEKCANEIKKKFEKDPEKINSLKEVFDLIENKKNKKDEKPPTEQPKTESKMEYVWMIIFAIALRFIIRYFRGNSQKTPPPTNEKPFQ